jgi:hypothetical protein
MIAGPPGGDNPSAEQATIAVAHGVIEAIEEVRTRLGELAPTRQRLTLQPLTLPSPLRGEGDRASDAGSGRRGPAPACGRS